MNSNPQKARLGIRLSKSEYAQIKNRAELSGFTLSEYLRRAALSDDERPLIVVDVATLKRIHTNLRRSGSLVNQIARALSTRHDNEWALNDLRVTLKSLEQASADVSEFITEVRNSI